MPPSRHSNPLLLPVIIIGGIMGLLAGYGALTLMRERGIISPAGSVVEAPVVETARNPTPVAEIVRPNQSDRPKPQSQKTPSVRPRIAPIAPQPQDDSKGVVRIGRPDAPKSYVAEQDTIPSEPIAKGGASTKQDESAEEQTASSVPPPSALIPITFQKPVLRAIATAPEGTDLEDVLCDIGFTPQLVKDASQADPAAVTIVFPNLHCREKRLHELPTDISGAGATIDVAMVKRQSVVCELRPRFSLPRNGIEEFTVDRATQIHNKLNKMLSDINEYGTLLPKMTNELSALKSDLSAAQQLARTPGTLPQAAAARNSGVAQANRLATKIDNKQTAIDRAEALVADESAVRTELKCLDELDKFGRDVVNVSAVYVRFHVGDATLPAEVK